MDTVVVWFLEALAIAALLGQIVGFVRAKGRSRHPLVRILLIVLWCGALWFLSILFFGFNYCEAGCSDRPLNGPSWLILAGWLVLNVGTLWLALRGIAKLP
jgi:hypothetical protein